LSLIGVVLIADALGNRGGFCMGVPRDRLKNSICIQCSALALSSGEDYCERNGWNDH
jgi:hypothetical protein